MTDKTKLSFFGAIAGFCVVVAFGTGVIATAMLDSKPIVGGGGTAASAGNSEVIEVELGDLYIKPAKLAAPAGVPLEIRVHNAGATEHNFSLTGIGSTEMIPAGESDVLNVGALDAGNYDFICQVSGHADAGMSGVLAVGGAKGGTNSASGHDMSSMSNMSAKQMMKHDAAVTASFPAKTKGVGGQEMQPKIVDGVKVFELTADEIRWEVEPGKVVDAMAYNGQIPGPQIHAQVGDRVRIVLHNDLAEPTIMHFHGLTVPNAMDGVPALTQDAVLPGDSFTYEFTLKNSGSNMYHSHFNAAKQVPSGLLGAFIIDDPNDPVVDVDTTLVLNDGPLGFTLNAKSFPATAPIVMNQGETLRIRYMNEGIQIHPMHLHGLVQKVIAKDGHLLEHPYLADTVLVAPGERYDVLVEGTRVGAWAFHCHVLTHVEGPQGMFGMVTAVVVQ
ncbi:MAG: hypothetical protein QOG54_2227 [Actinomycetota bacterium]|nr:hypothetical protein [Actinomycetota bacterium]